MDLFYLFRQGNNYEKKSPLGGLIIFILSMSMIIFKGRFRVI